MIKIPELLAPAGGYEQFIAAVENGADAVYIGGKLFSAREKAENFSDEELVKAIEYAHVRDVNVYITMNILINDAEMSKAVNYAKKIYEMGADAIIVQDIGFAKVIKELMPDFPVHASTQSTVYNLEGVEEYAKLGYERVILARELSVGEITEISKKASIEIETFVHGALCISYSGQCYMSSLIGGRSGNRGKCAQPCRLPFSVIEKNKDNFKAISKKGYLLSPKDLKLLNNLDEVINSGVKSIKIEGRMKSPEYVAVVTRIYRKYLDEYQQGIKPEITIKDEKNLAQVFNRGGFSTGFYKGKQGVNLITKERSKHWGNFIGTVRRYESSRDVIKVNLVDSLSIGDGIEIVNEDLPGNIVTYISRDKERVVKANKNDSVLVGDIRGKVNDGDKVYKITDKELMKEARSTYTNTNNRKAKIKMKFIAKLKDSPLLSVVDGRGTEIIIKSEKEVEAAINRALDNATIEKQLGKTGSTPFEIEDLIIDIDDNISVPVSELNKIRREALEILEEKRRVKYTNRTVVDGKYNMLINETEDTKKALLSAFFYGFDKDVLKYFTGADIVYIPYKSILDEDFERICGILKERGIKVCLWLSAITKGKYDEFIRESIQKINDKDIDGILIGNLSQAGMIKENVENIHGDYSLNIYNSKSVNLTNEYGLSSCTLSHELTLDQIQNMYFGGLDIEATVYGRIPLMISEHCPVGSEIAKIKSDKKCKLCKEKTYGLADRKNMPMPLVLDDTDCRATILNTDKLYVPEIVQNLVESGVNIFRMYFFDETKEEIEEICSEFKEAIDGKSDFDIKYGTTRGHYFRGI